MPSDKNTYIDGYGVERKNMSPVESAINTVKQFFTNSKKNYKDLVNTPGLGWLYPSSGAEVALMAAGPLLKGVNKATNALEYLTEAGMKIDKNLLFQPWFKEMKSGAWTGQSGALTEAAREASKDFAIAKKEFGMTNAEAGEMAASRFRYLLERIGIDEFKQGGILKRK